MFSLFPKEDKFYILLQDLADQGKNAAAYLKTCVESSGEQRKSAKNAISACKAEAKRLSTEITRQACLTFITPLDREDLQSLSSELYKITKTIEKVSERLALHNIEHAGGDFSRQIDLIVQETTVMDSMLRSLMTKKTKSQAILDEVAALQDLENRGDAILSELLVALFKDNRDTRDLLLRKDIYDMLEKIIDRYRNVADIVLQITLKHS